MSRVRTVPNFGALPEFGGRRRKKLARAQDQRAGDLVKARPRRSTSKQYVFGVLEVGRKGGFSVNGIAVAHSRIEVLRSNEKRLLKIFLKTRGHCHFCGDE